LICDEGDWIGKVSAKVGGLLEETRGREVVGRQTLAEESGAERAALRSVLIHQPFQLGGKLGHSKAKLTHEVAVGDGFTRRSKSGKPILKPLHSASGP
jgi:hypothetical protein